MRDATFEPMDAFETRLAQGLVSASEIALTALDASAIRRRAIADASVTLPWRMTTPMARRIVLVTAAVFLAALLGMVLAVGLRGPSTDRLAFIRAGTSVFVSDADGTDARQIASRPPGGPAFSDVDWAPDRQHLAVLVAGDLTTDLLIVSPDGRVDGSFTGGPSMGVAWAPDATRLAVHSGSEPGSFVVVGIDGQRLGSIELPQAFQVGGIGWIGGWSGGFAWSPDGRWIAAPGCVSACNTKSDGHVLIVATDGTGSRDLTTEPFGDSWLAWSDQGVLAVYRACFGRATGCRPGIVELTPDRPTVREVQVPGDASVGWLDWSPDGARLVAVIGDPGGVADRLAVIAPDGSVRVLAMGAWSEIWRARWSSDGRAIVYSGLRTPGSPGSIWAVSAAGGSPVLLVEGADPAFAGP